jgi:hypothetical protein
MYKYTYLLRMTDTMTSQNSDPSSWDTLYNSEKESELCFVTEIVRILKH